MVGDRERFLAVGMNEHLPKPVTLRALAEVLSRYGASLGASMPALAPTETPESARVAEADPRARDEFQAIRRALVAACEAAGPRLDEDRPAAATWRRLRSAALWAGDERSWRPWPNGRADETRGRHGGIASPHAVRALGLMRRLHVRQ